MQSPFGWHLLRATAIVPEQVKPFDSVKDAIRHELALEQATSQLPDFATKLDDELAAGTALDAAAEQLRLPMQKLENIDSSGHTAANERVAPDRLTADILTPIFAATQGETSLLEQTQDGRYFIFRIDAVNPAHERTLDEVRDQGIGIPPDDVPRLFESFHRGTNVGNIQGTGIGLHIVKECVTLHCGSIDVESEPHKGATFHVRLHAPLA